MATNNPFAHRSPRGMQVQPLGPPGTPQPAAPPAPQQQAQPAPVQPQPAPVQPEVQERQSRWEQYLSNPTVQAALAQFGISMLAPRGNFATALSASLGEAGGAAGRSKQAQAAEEEREFEQGQAERRTAADEARAGAAQTRAEAAQTQAGAAQTQAGAAQTRAGASVTSAEAAKAQAEAAKSRVGVLREQLKEDAEARFRGEDLKLFMSISGNMFETYKAELEAWEDQSLTSESPPPKPVAPSFNDAFQQFQTAKTGLGASRRGPIGRELMTDERLNSILGTDVEAGLRGLQAMNASPEVMTRAQELAAQKRAAGAPAPGTPKAPVQSPEADSKEPAQSSSRFAHLTDVISGKPNRAAIREVVDKLDSVASITQSEWREVFGNRALRAALRQKFGDQFTEAEKSVKELQTQGPVPFL